MKTRIQPQMKIGKVFALFLLCTSLLNCSRSTSVQNEDIKKAMVNLLYSYQNSCKELNADKTIAHFVNSPEFMIFMGGTRFGYNEIVTQFKNSYQNMSKYEGKWDTILVSVLNPTAAAAATTFHEVVTDKNGAQTRLKGEATWIAIKQEKDWKLIYCHGFSLPDTLK